MGRNGTFALVVREAHLLSEHVCEIIWHRLSQAKAALFRFIISFHDAGISKHVTYVQTVWLVVEFTQPKRSRPALLAIIQDWIFHLRRHCAQSPEISYNGETQEEGFGQRGSSSASYLLMYPVLYNLPILNSIDYGSVIEEGLISVLG